MIYLVALDWNGTLMDDQDHAFSGVVAIFKYYGIPPPSSPQSFFSEIKSDYLECYQKFGIPQNVTIEDLNRLWKAHFNTHRNGARLRRGVNELLLWLREKGIEVAIVSGEADSILQRRLSEFGLRPFIKTAWGDCLDKGSALKRMSVAFSLHPNTIIYVDDNCNGLKAAKAIGAITIGFTGGWQSPARIGAATPDFMAHTMYEVRERINKLMV